LARSFGCRDHKSATLGWYIPEVNFRVTGRFQASAPPRFLYEKLATERSVVLALLTCVPAGPVGYGA